MAWRLVQLSDLQLRAFGPHEQALARQVRDLRADGVVLSGDAIDRADAVTLQQALAMNPQARRLLNERWSRTRGDRTLR